MNDEVAIKGAWPLLIFDEAGQLLWHIEKTNPPQYAPDAHLTQLWYEGEQLRMKHAQAIKLAIEALEQECKRVAVNANLFEKMHLDTPATRNAAKRRTDCRAAIEVLQQPEQLAMELEAV